MEEIIMLTLNEHGEFVSNSRLVKENRVLKEASSPEDFVIKDGVLKKYAGPGGDVVIPDGVTSIAGTAFFNCTSLSSVTIPNSVTSIGREAFDGCTSLTSITIPDSVTSIGDRAFYECTRLTSIVIPNSVTRIGRETFKFCRNLTTIDIPDSVTHIGEQAFWGCINLAAINIPNGTMSIGYSTFRECHSLTHITIPDSVKLIDLWAFESCSALKSISIPSSVKKIHDEAFGDVSDNLTIICAKNSAADKFAKKAGITVEYNGEIKKQSKSSGESQIITISAEGEREVQTGDIDIQHIAEEFLDQDKIDNKFKKDLQDILSKKFKNTTVVEFDSGELYVDDPEAEIKIKTPYSVDEILDALSDEELYGSFEIVIPGNHRELDSDEYDEDEEIYVDVDFKYSDFSEYVE